MADDGHRKPKREDQVYASSSAQYRILVSREAFVVNKETLSKLCNNYCAVSGARKRKRERERERGTFEPIQCVGAAAYSP